MQLYINQYDIQWQKRIETQMSQWNNKIVYIKQYGNKTNNA